MLYVGLVHPLDPYGLHQPHVSGVEERLRLVRETAGEGRFARLELNALLQWVVLTDRRQSAAEELTSRWTQLTAGEILQSPYGLIGTVEQMVEEVLARQPGASRTILYKSLTWMPSPQWSPASPENRCSSVGRKRAAHSAAAIIFVFGTAARSVCKSPSGYR
jgi:hypothetical protein